MKNTITYLLFTDNFFKAQEEINQVNGHITVRLSDRAFLVNLPNNINLETFKFVSITEPIDLDPLSVNMVRAWKNGPTKNVDIQNNFNNDSGNLPEENLYGVNNILAPSHPTSEKMLGSIFFEYFIVQGPTDDLKFSQAEIDNINANIITGLNFLSEMSKDKSTIFTLSPKEVSIAANPLPGKCSNYETCEAVFRDPVLQSLGYPPGRNGMLSLVSNLQKNNKTDWAYAGFVVKYPMYHSAYALGIYICLQYKDTRPWLLSNTFAHETCHIFGAADEYPISNCTCASSGIYNVPNYNCDNCTDSGFVFEPCIMKNYDFPTLCSWTKGQIGWYDPTPNGDPSLCTNFYQTNNFLQIFYIDKTNKLSYIQKPQLGASKYKNLTYETTGTDPNYQAYPGGKPGVINSLIPITQQPLTSVVYRNSNKEIILLSFQADTQLDFSIIPFNVRNLVTDIKAPLALGDPSIISRYDDGSIHISYLDLNSEVTYIMIDAEGKAVYTPINDIPTANGDPIITCTNDSIEIFYVDDTSSVIHLVNQNGDWTPYDLTATTGATLVGAHTQLSYATHIHPPLHRHIVYTDENGAIADLGWSDIWRYQDLTAKSGANARAVSAPSISALTMDLSFHIVFRISTGEVGHIHWEEDGKKWIYDNLNSISNAPSGGGNPNIIQIQNDLYVFYLNIDGTAIEKINCSVFNYFSWNT